MMLKDKYLAKKYLNLISNANDRGLSFTLTLEELKKLLNTEECFYTGKKITRANRSIERLNSSLGYTRENCVIVDQEINSLKADLSFNEIRELQSLTLKQLEALDHFYKRNGWSIDGLKKLKTININANDVFEQNELA